MNKDNLPNWVCIPDDDGSHLTTYVAKDDNGFGGCPIHEIAGGCSIPQPDLANLIAQEANKAQQQLLRELIEQLPEEPEDDVRAGMPDRAFDDGYNAGYTVLLKEVTALLNKKLQAYGGDV